jgi:hypothetical protein
MNDAGSPTEAGKFSESRPGPAVLLRSWLQTALRRGINRIYRHRDTRCMELLETLSLGGKRQLMLVVCDGRRFLLGAGADSVSTIAEIGPTPVSVGGEVGGCGLAASPGCPQGEVRCN